MQGPTLCFVTPRNLEAPRAKEELLRMRSCLTSSCSSGKSKSSCCMSSKPERQWCTAKYEKKERKVYAIRRHDRSICTQEQSETVNYNVTIHMCIAWCLSVRLVCCNGAVCKKRGCFAAEGVAQHAWGHSSLAVQTLAALSRLCMMTLHDY